ncbi:MAG TPA: tRNA 2-thiouridine(34) synthase MnmA [Candidatus Bathyarchaeia archaeon]|nr:tRNA 2-thiouridine(34) synthase MnmA [Candidatus Bathyarchaeia archaeon]
MKNRKRKIVVGMSGGVDSSMALVLLKQQGWQPVGVSLKLPVWQEAPGLSVENIYSSNRSLQIAARICRNVNVPHHIIDVRSEFKKTVIGYFISELKNNKTPNPCVICNRHLKFKKLLEFAEKEKADFIATGHYARIRKNQQTGKYELLKAKDKTKDQTYALCFLPQEWLGKIVFPLGNYAKKEVYQIAKSSGFEFFLKRKQSQDFCFATGLSLLSFLKKEIGEKSGDIIDNEGNVLGQHSGLHFYTIGQRRRLGLSGGPYFVKGIDSEKNILIVTKNEKEVTQRELKLYPFHFISGRSLPKKQPVMAKVRYRQVLSKALLYPPEKNKLRLVFGRPQRAVTSGQFAVFYQSEVCLGGGVIL